MVTTNKRTKEAIRRQEKVRRLGVQSVAKKVFKTATWQRMSYSAPFYGVSDTGLEKMRTQARHSAMYDKAGACRTTVVGLRLGEENDPAVVVVQKLVKQWLKWWNNNKSMRPEVTRTWMKLKVKLSEKKPSSRWMAARGPIAAMILSLQRIGWDPRGPARWADAEGNLWVATGVLDLEEVMKQQALLRSRARKRCGLLHCKETPEVAAGQREAGGCRVARERAHRILLHTTEEEGATIGRRRYLWQMRGGGRDSLSSHLGVQGEPHHSVGRRRE